MSGVTLTSYQVRGLKDSASTFSAGGGRYSGAICRRSTRVLGRLVFRLLFSISARSVWED